VVVYKIWTGKYRFNFELLAYKQLQAAPPGLVTKARVGIPNGYIHVSSTLPASYFVIPSVYRRIRSSLAEQNNMQANATISPFSM
jgi:hypothetical protein